MLTIFDSARFVNPWCCTGRPFATGIDQAPAAAQAQIDPIRRAFAGVFIDPSQDPTDYTPVFHPTPEDDAWQAATSPLNHSAVERDAEADAVCFGHYEPTPADWSEYEAWACGNGQFGHTREH